MHADILSFSNAVLQHGSYGKPLAIALLFAFLYGCFHVAGPGHGKSVIVGYFLSHDAKLHRGVWLGIWIAFTHVASAVITVILLALLFRHSAASLEDSRIIRLITYGAIISLGCFLLVRALRSQSDHDHDHSHPSGAVACIAGAIPCTGSLLILTIAVANGTYLVGALLLFALAAGMATTMTAIGLLTIAARRRFALSTLNVGSRKPILRVLTLAGPALIIIVGTIFFITTLHSPMN